ncbi:hypothetical protein [Xenorhabdus nematophila]|uniref:hypothetical protein n=1 Tax=Xenorhabdus nematophila TaxID=628 RepID=UPI0032B868C7
MMLDMFGYVGTILVALSFTSNNIIRLRVFNIIGAMIITIYALAISAYPVAALDGLIVIINGYQLVNLYNRRKKNI